jgi:catechol 2,3-dioxygenase-like lactoylglutathione lyase family enzyme
MSLPLDHIVIAVQDLERTIADYQSLGFNVLRGGEHPGRSTHNALVVFADGVYFELIAWRAPRPRSAGGSSCSSTARAGRLRAAAH